MKDIMGIIHHLKNEEAFGEITRNRCIASVPFGGRYRLVDFALSNLVNAGVGNIGVIISLNMSSLMDHLGSGKEWGLDRKHEGLFILPTARDLNSKNKRNVDFEDLYKNINYIQRSRQEYVVILGSNMVCNLDFKDAINFHKEMMSDVTIIYKDDYDFFNGEFENNTFLEIENDARITAIYSKPRLKEKSKLSMGMYILKRELLLDILQQCNITGRWDLVSDVLSKNLQQLNIYGYGYEGYLAIINSLGSFYRHHFELLNPEVWQELFFKNGVIYTKHKDGPPAKYSETSNVSNVLVANGCRIEGRVENSILYRNVNIAKGSVIRNCIIMAKAEIEEDVVLDNVILDKDVWVRKGARLIGEKNRPVVIGKKQVV